MTIQVRLYIACRKEFRERGDSDSSLGQADWAAGPAGYKMHHRMSPRKKKKVSWQSRPERPTGSEDQATEENGREDRNREKECGHR